MIKSHTKLTFYTTLPDDRIEDDEEIVRPSGLGVAEAIADLLKGAGMNVAEIVAETIIINSLQPQFALIGRQLRRTFDMHFKLVLGDQVVLREIHFSRKEASDPVACEVKALAVEIFTKGKYRYILQCLFPKIDDLEGFSGVHFSGLVTIQGDVGSEKGVACTYSYNSWKWNKELEDL